MSSRADDFDVRHRDGREDRGWGNGAYGGQAGNGHGGFGDTVDYDLGYDDAGFDTQGFRSPTAGYSGHQETGYQGNGGVGTAPRRGNGRGGSHARPSGGPQGTQAFQGTAAFQGPMGPGGPAGPGGPFGPGGPGGPGGPAGPGRRGLRRRDGSAVTKVKGSWWRHWTWRKALGVLLACVGGIVVLGAIAVVMAYEETPIPSSAMAATGYAQTIVESTNGTIIGRFGTTDRVDLTYNQFPQPLVYAVLAAEDRSFFTEGGVSPTGILRAAYEDLKGGDFQGGSTITQEFVRQYYTGIGTQQTLSRKLKEIFVAMKVSKEKSKEWILTNYLNTIYFGQGAYGVEAAAQTYYNKKVGQLSVAQDAVIAAVIQEPSLYTLPQYRSNLIARWHYVLNGMVATGHLTAQQAAAMKFPAPGDYVPQTVGSDPWDPYVLNVVYNELVDVYHFSQSQIYNGGYIIKTSINDQDMEALYQAVQQNEVTMAQGGVPLPDYAQVGAVLENPATGAIEAMYPGPGYPGKKYVNHEGATQTMTTKECEILHCEVNMAVYNREQVGSSFKPYVLSTAVSEGMNVQTSTLDGFDPSYIPPATPFGPNIYATSTQADAPPGSYKVTNDSTDEDGPFTPQLAMAESINTAYTGLWQRAGASNVAHMAQLFGVNTAAACITANCGSTPAMEDEAGVALGQASLTVTEQATMLATIDDNGIYHDAHVITSITTQSGMVTPIKITSYPVFDPSNPTLNAEEATQVQYAMSEDDASYGTAPNAALSNGEEIIAKTGTTNTGQSAFFLGAIPTQVLAVGMFTDESSQALPLDLGGDASGNYGGTWPATIWHTYAEDMFVPLGVEHFQTPVFTGTKWDLVPPNLRNVGKKHAKKNHNNQNNQNQNGQPTGFPTPGNPQPEPSYSCDPEVVTCAPNYPGQPNAGTG